MENCGAQYCRDVMGLAGDSICFYVVIYVETENISMLDNSFIEEDGTVMSHVKNAVGRQVQSKSMSNFKNS